MPIDKRGIDWKMSRTWNKNCSTDHFHYFIFFKRKDYEDLNPNMDVTKSFERSVNIWYDRRDLFVSCNWVVTPWQKYSTHQQYIERYKTNNTQNKTILEECGPCPVLASYTLAFALQPRKKHGKTSVRVAASKNAYTTIFTQRKYPEDLNLKVIKSPYKITQISFKWESRRHTRMDGRTYGQKWRS